MHFKRLPQVEVHLMAVRSRPHSRHTVCQLFLPATGLKDEPHQVLALDIVVVAAEIIREPVRTAVIDMARFDPEYQVFGAEQEVEALALFPDYAPEDAYAG